MNILTQVVHDHHHEGLVDFLGSWYDEEFFTSAGESRGTLSKQLKDEIEASVIAYCSTYFHMVWEELRTPDRALIDATFELVDWDTIVKLCLEDIFVAKAL